MSDDDTKPRKKRKRRKPRKRPAKDAPLDASERLAEHARVQNYTVLRHQRYLGLGATVSIVGLALVGTHDSKVGAFVVIVGLLVLLGSVHLFGRLGTERVRD